MDPGFRRSDTRVETGAGRRAGLLSAQPAHSHCGMNLPGQSSWPLVTGSSVSMLETAAALMILFSRRGEPELSPVETRMRTVLSVFALAQLTQVWFCPS